jgi:hypothetical protein
MLDSTLVDSDMIINIIIILLSILSGEYKNPPNNRRSVWIFLAIALLISTCSLSYREYVRSGDIAFLMTSILAVLFMLFIFCRLVIDRR